jgi:hypothetical protein
MADEVPQAAAVELPAEQPLPAKASAGRLAVLAEEQIRGLVRQLFLPGRTKHARQIVFSAVDQQTDVAALCMHVGEALARQASGTTCVVEALPQRATEDVHKINRAPLHFQKRFGVLRDASQQLSSRLWFMPSDILLDGNGRFSAHWLRGRLAELRLEFDYTVLQGPAAGLHDEAALLGSLCDGVVLVLRANTTRRMAAQRVKETLYVAKARLLGTVLSERTFPIPEAIYERL